MYSFTDDWFSHNIGWFERFLAPLRDQECRLLEIGSHEGRSACWLLDNIVRHEKSTLLCIDLDDVPNLRENLQAAGKSSQVELCVGYSKDILKTLPESFFDFIYIDGCHKRIEVLEDAVLSFRLAKVGGLMCFDDYGSDTMKAREQDDAPKRSINAFITIYREKIKILHMGWQCWLRKVAA